MLLLVRADCNSWIICQASDASLCCFAHPASYSRIRHYGLNRTSNIRVPMQFSFTITITVRGSLSMELVAQHRSYRGIHIIWLQSTWLQPIWRLSKDVGAAVTPAAVKKTMTAGILKATMLTVFSDFSFERLI